jgi:cyanophycinase
VDGIEVCSQECAAPLSPAGTLSRAAGAVAAGLVDRAVAVDENTALFLPDGGAPGFEVIGSGNCRDIRRTGEGCSLSVRSANT